MRKKTREIQDEANTYAIPLDAELLKASPADIRKVCVSAFTQKIRTYEVVFANDT